MTSLYGAKFLFFSIFSLSTLIFPIKKPVNASSFVLDVEADTYIRTDLNARRNDNYGKTNIIQIGTGRGGGGIPFGGADAQRILLRFDVDNSFPQAKSAILELTISAFGSTGGTPILFQLEINEVLEPWIEGNGCEAAFSGTLGCPIDAVSADEAFGVAWDGIDSNNQNQPSFNPTPIATVDIEVTNTTIGDIVNLDITSLYNSWASGNINEGLLIRDTTSDGNFRELAFGAKEKLDPGTENTAPNTQAARLLVEIDDTPNVPEPSSLLGLFVVSSIGFLALFSHNDLSKE